MKFSTKRTVSGFLAAVTVLTAALTSVFAFGASVSAAKDPKDIDRVVVDCRTAESFAKTSSVLVHKPTATEPDPLTGGKYSFHEGMKAMSVDYNDGAPNGREYRILTKFNKNGTITEEYKYFVIVYAAKATKPYRLSVWNATASGPEVNIVTDGKNTNAKFVISEPFDISGAGKDGRSALSRWINGPSSTIAFMTNEKNASFFIKEYAFFKSPEDAKAYYAGVDLNKDPLEYGENAVKPTTETSTLPASASSGTEVEVAPVYISFASAADLDRNAQCRVFSGENDGLGGSQRYAEVNGVGAIQILAHKYTGKASAGSSDYRIMLAMKGKGYLSENHKYLRITYMTTDKEANSITLTNNASGQSAVLVPDTSVSKGKFVTSAPVDVRSLGMITRWVSGNHNSLEYKNNSKNPTVYIKEIIIFGTKAQAEAYDPSKPFDLSTEFKPTGTAPAPAATPAKPVDPNNNVFEVAYKVVEEPKTSSGTASTAAPVIVDFSSRDAMQKNMLFRAFTGENSGLEGKYHFAALPDGSTALKLLPHKYTGKASAGSSAYFRMMPHFALKDMLTADHKYVRIVFMTDDIAPRTVTLTNNASGKQAILVTNTSISRGEFKVSAPVDISLSGVLDRYIIGNHNSFEYNTSVEDSTFYIKEMGFFTSTEQAYEYYGDEMDPTQIQYVELSLGEAGTAQVNRKDTWGYSEDKLDHVEISYAATCEWGNVHYRADIKAKNKETLKDAGRYVRILYSAENPADVKQASIFINNNKTGDRFKLSDNVVNTNGNFVLSDVTLLDNETFDRFTNVQNAIVVNANSEGGKYCVKSIYFFATREEAEVFGVIDSYSKVTVNGNDISNYSIVVSADAPENVVTAAEKMATSIGRITGFIPKVVTDESPATGYEILVGKSTRPNSRANMDKILALGDNAYGIFVVDNDIVITSDLGLAVVTAIDTAKGALFFDGFVGAPKEIDITASIDMIDVDKQYPKVTRWLAGEPVPNPTVVSVSFDADEGYFNEDNGEENWSYADGTYNTAAAAYASSYMHVYEKNVIYKAKLSYTAENGGNMGILARVNSEHAYVKAGYDFKAGGWYVESRDGRDNYLDRNGFKAAAVAPGTVYELILDVNGDYASLTVNGEAVIVNAKVNHVTPGRLGIYAERATVSVDDASITLVSGQGTVFKNVYHTKLPYDSYLEGGTVHTRNDGSLSFVHPYGVSFKSTDGGKSWQESEKWSDNWNFGYSNMIRLNNGDFLRIGQETVAGGLYKVARISTDDGETWGQPYTICDGKFNKNTVAHGSNMNDKLVQFPENSKYPNRIFYCQTYEVNASWSGGITQVDGRQIFVQFFYSDDNGKTWTKSETDSWQIEGIESELRISESKILICEDGTVRMYNSWNDLGYIVYSDSTDGGVNFGPIHYMYDFPCPASSMQFVRDPYADNDYTYYMVWPNGETFGNRSAQPRSRLSLAKTTNGKDWVYLGDIWRWESTYTKDSMFLHHIVDPFIYVTEEYVIAGSGFSDSKKLDGEGGPDVHQGQRQHIFTIRKDTLPEGIDNNRYADVDYGADYYDAITFVTEKGYMAAKSENAFEPHGTMNGGTFKMLFNKLAGGDSSAYTDGIEFNASVTVQQVLTSLAAYAGKKPAAVPSGKTASDFSDSADVAAWAKESVEWAVANGIYDGIGGLIKPDEPAKRGVIAKIIYNFVSTYGN